MLTTEIKDNSLTPFIIWCKTELFCSFIHPEERVNAIASNLHSKKHWTEIIWVWQWPGDVKVESGILRILLLLMCLKFPQERLWEWNQGPIIRQQILICGRVWKLHKKSLIVVYTKMRKCLNLRFTRFQRCLICYYSN